MGEATAFLTQSRYYSPVFNSAIFDGPVRVYFAQHQESLALKVYFRLKERLRTQGEDLRYGGKNLFVMLYPCSESFALSFSTQPGGDIVQEPLGEDWVFGVNGPLMDEDYEVLYQETEKVMLAWRESLATAGLE